MVETPTPESESTHGKRHRHGRGMLMKMTRREFIKQTAAATTAAAAAAGIPATLFGANFATDAGLATIAPTTGTSLTDSAGVALATLRPASLAVNGAGKVTATITMGGATVTSEANYTVLVAPVTSANVAVTLVNASGSQGGAPYITAAVANLAPGASISLVALSKARVRSGSNGLPSSCELM